jgi:hypothetical protein
MRPSNQCPFPPLCRALANKFSAIRRRHPDKLPIQPPSLCSSPTTAVASISSSFGSTLFRPVPIWRLFNARTTTRIECGRGDFLFGSAGRSDPVPFFSSFPVFDFENEKISTSWIRLAGPLHRPSAPVGAVHPALGSRSCR